MAKILIADDSEILRKVVHKLLEKDGHEILEANTGARAVEIAKSTVGLDLVITDLNMPGGNGMEVCQQIHALEGYHDLPILLLTIDSDSDVRTAARKAGILMHLSKPVSHEKLLSSVHKILSRGH